MQSCSIPINKTPSGMTQDILVQGPFRSPERACRKIYLFFFFNKMPCHTLSKSKLAQKIYLQEVKRLANRSHHSKEIVKSSPKDMLKKKKIQKKLSKVLQKM
jgi:hypothetical protein